MPSLGDISSYTAVKSHFGKVFYACLRRLEENGVKDWKLDIRRDIRGHQILKFEGVFHSIFFKTPYIEGLDLTRRQF